MHHSNRPIKYCYECDFHFKAHPEQHGETYHDDGLFMYVEGTWRDAKLAEMIHYE